MWDEREVHRVSGEFFLLPYSKLEGWRSLWRQVRQNQVEDAQAKKLRLMPELLPGLKNPAKCSSVVKP